MEQENDIDYYRRREAGARRMAAGSSDASIRCIHTGMADQYAAKVREMTGRPKLTIV